MAAGQGILQKLLAFAAASRALEAEDEVEAATSVPSTGIVKQLLKGLDEVEAKTPTPPPGPPPLLVLWAHQRQKEQDELEDTDGFRAPPRHRWQPTSPIRPPSTGDTDGNRAPMTPPMPPP